MLLLSIVVSFAAFGYAYWLYLWVKKQPQENKTITKVTGLIQQGARTFLRRQDRILLAFAGGVAVIIFLLLPAPVWTGSFSHNIINAISYIAGTLLSALSGKIGIEVATIANGRSAEAAQKGLKPSFMIAFHWYI